MPISDFRRKRSVPIGSRDRPMTIDKRPVADSVDGSGAPDETSGWTVLSKAEPMQRDDGSGTERFTAHRESSTVGTVWQMGYRIDMDPELLDVPKLRRLRYPGTTRVLDIVAASVVGVREAIELITEAKTG